MWAGADDVRARWVSGDLPASDEVVDTLIADAEDALAAAIPGLPALIEGGTIPHDRAIRVVSRIVIRLLRNPDGVRTLQETTGQFSGSTTYAGDTLGEIVVTDADRRELLGKGTARGRRAFSFSPEGIT